MKKEIHGLAVSETVQTIVDMVAKKNNAKPEHILIKLGDKELPNDQTMDELRLKGYNKARPLAAHECMRITV